MDSRGSLRNLCLIRLGMTQIVLQSSFVPMSWSSSGFAALIVTMSPTRSSTSSSAQTWFPVRFGQRARFKTVHYPGRASSMSIIPHTLSSIAPYAKSAMLKFCVNFWEPSPSWILFQTSWRTISGSFGSELPRIAGHYLDLRMEVDPYSHYRKLSRAPIAHNHHSNLWVED